MRQDRIGMSAMKQAVAPKGNRPSAKRIGDIICGISPEEIG